MISQVNQNILKKLKANYNQTSNKTKFKDWIRKFTALLSVATPDMTNIRKNVITNSITKDCPLDPDGNVPENCSCLPVNNSLRVPAASVDPSTWATT